MRLYVEFGGGLGDAFNTIYLTDRYTTLSRLSGEDRVTVAVISPNRFVKELFLWHPNAKQIDVRDFDQWPNSEDSERRALLGLPQACPPYKDREDPVVFYPSPGDEAVLASLPGRYIIVSASAGGADRSIPQDILDATLSSCIDAKVPVVVVGRTAATRHGKATSVPARPGVVSVIDRLSAPGTAVAVERSAGVICCHSSICLLAWRLEKPVFLLYPPMTVGFLATPHLANYFFGVERPGNFHGTFSGFSRGRLLEFMRMTADERDRAIVGLPR